jgi:peptidoglycan hydrolase-like protein with peptidoglycan-binding domain
MIEATVDGILSNSTRPAIIILQSDHGPAATLDWDNPDSTGLRERLAILNAYYLPGSSYTRLGRSITPVNTFRVVFNHYFGTNLEPLRDRSYFSTRSHPYRFICVDDILE